jgi:hypothetical protein
VVVGVETLGDDVGVLELVALHATDRLEADRERRQAVLARLGEQARRCRLESTPAGQQAADGHVGDQSAIDCDPQCSRTASSQSRSDQSALSWRPAEVGAQYVVVVLRPSGSIATSDAGGTLVTPRRIVRGGGTTEWKVR